MTRTPAAQDPRATLIDACAHLDAAATQLTAPAAAAFDSRRALAGQLQLLASAIHPGIQAPPRRDDPTSATAHLDQALRLLAAVDPTPVDLPTWIDQLRQLREAVCDVAPGANGSAR